MRIDFIKAQFPSDKAFEDDLEKRDISMTEFKSDIHGQLMKNKLIESKVENLVTVTEDMVQNYYNDNRKLFHQDEVVRLSQIVLKCTPDMDEDKQQKIREKLMSLRKKIMEENTFGQIAKEHSEDKSGSRGGDIGFVSREQLVNPLARVAFRLPVGKVSEPVKTRFGYHLLKVLDHRDEGYIPYNEVKHQIRENLWKKAVENEEKQYIAMLRKNAEITIKHTRFENISPPEDREQPLES
jgi:parvulin-like peptidyl-prolyl isomerase